MVEPVNARAEAGALPATGGEIASSSPVHGLRCRCDGCRISMHVADSPKPSVCPYCHATMVVTPYALPPAAAAAPDRDGDVAAKLRRLYARPRHWMMVALFLLGTGLLAAAVYFQVSNFESYWYAPLVNLYSLIAGIFIVSRFLLAAFYHAPLDRGFEPTVTVIVPCRNEQAAIGRTIDHIYAEGYPIRKKEVVVVNDGSTDQTLAEMLKAQARHQTLVIVDFETNRGLCHGMAVATLMARGEFLIFVDSDTFLFPGAIRKVVQGFVDPMVGGIAGHTDVENANKNLLTKMQDVRYFFSYKIMKAAESVFGAVSCLPGCFSAYRRVCVMHVLDRWLNSKFMGVYGDFGDDRSMTNFIFKDYRILYDDEALATTLAPENWGQYIRQQARWNRSYVREVFVAGRFMWRKHPVPALSWYAMMIMPILEPVVILSAMVIAPIQSGTMTPSYVIGVLAITLVWSLHFLQHTGRKHWWTGFLFTITYTLFFSWQAYYALLTMRRTKWGTR